DAFTLSLIASVLYDRGDGTASQPVTLAVYASLSTHARPSSRLDCQAETFGPNASCRLFTPLRPQGTAEGISGAPCRRLPEDRPRQCAPHTAPGTAAAPRPSADRERALAPWP